MRLDDDELVRRSNDLAADLLRRSEQLTTTPERRRRRRLRRLLADDDGASLVFRLADRVLRPVDATTAAAQLGKVAAGPLPGISPVDALALKGAGLAAGSFPGPVTALVGARLRYETRQLVLPARRPLLAWQLARMRRAGVRPNLNLLGEAVLGDEEAAARAAAVAALLSRPDVECISVKASSVSAGLSLVDFEGSVERVRQALVPLYRQAVEASPHKLVNLDMEELRDLPITVEAFCRALSAPGLGRLTAGIALQAYLPGSHEALGQLLEFSERRVAAGDAPVRVRLVKGANLAMERAVAELAGWPQPVYPEKVLTDASYKAMAERLLQASARGAVKVGIASHNLFDVAFALVLSAGSSAPVDIEMLAGMAPAQAAAVAERCGGVLLYTPVVAQEDFRNALAYLARRLDENTTPEGFLRHVLELAPGNPAWQEQLDVFSQAMKERHGVRVSPFQEQDRNVPASGAATWAGDTFHNDPPTDLSSGANRHWAASCLQRAAAEHTAAEHTPPDPIDQREVDAVVRAAAEAGPTWELMGHAARSQVVAGAGDVMARGRADAVTVMAAECGKVFEEADTEASEAIDYARWYGSGPGSLPDLLGELDVPVSSRPLGTVVVAPPWNFPYAIPAGGTLAALAAGNAVLLKPAPEARATAAALVRQLHRAGIPQDVLQLAPVADGDVGRHLICHDEVGAVVLTGSHETAEMFARWAPARRVLAETSGKNAIVVTATADVDQAVHDVVVSAFGHAGQKCSAASLAIVAAPVHDHSPFLRQLADAVRSLRAGEAWSPASQVGPIVGPFTPALERALTRLDPGESWLVEPERIGDRLWRPGVRLGVRPGSWAHTTEWFGPVLGIMRAADLAEALRWQNAVDFGLTAGLSSLDPDEHRYWADRVEAGNLYINRSTTGAVVGRQPFGGWKSSSHGPTAKAGGPNYLIGLRRWQDDPSSPTGAAQAEASYRKWWAELFSREDELAGLRSESNVLRYRPFFPGVTLRLGEGTADEDLHRATVLSSLTGTPLAVSSVARLQPSGSSRGIDVTTESDEAFAGRLAGGAGRRGSRLRLVGSASVDVYRAAAQAGLNVLDEPLCSCGRIELVRWLREQVVTRSLHRYGNITYERAEMGPAS